MAKHIWNVRVSWDEFKVRSYYAHSQEFAEYVIAHTI